MFLAGLDRTSIDLTQIGVPPLDSADGGRWMRQRAVFTALAVSGGSPQAVSALTALTAAFERVVALHEGEPEGTSKRKNVPAYLEALTGPAVHEELEGLPRISDAPSCGCGHGRQAHASDPDLCRECVGLDAARHGYASAARRTQDCPPKLISG